ncbi:MAG: hypothetical protein GF334_03360 [Candidatus Altiarchaeales archaeon]|nr:hypothetical protein [Candidatus Altiarchaeales archaeon]
MAVNVTVRDIVNFPGGTAKTITLDIAQVVPNGGSPEGDEIWVMSATTTATASGGGSIQNIFKNEMKRGFIRGVPPDNSLLTIGANYQLKVAIDEAIGNGVDVTLAQGSNLLPEDVAQDLEDKIRAEAEIGQGGAKAGNLSYLNAQVRFVNGVFRIESGTVSDRYTGSGRSSVVLAAPDLGTDARETLGLHITSSSEQLALRQVVETPLTSAYTSGDTLTVGSTDGLTAGDAFQVTDGANATTALVSGTESASVLRFTAVSGAGLGLENSFAEGAILKRLDILEGAEPVSVVRNVDQLYRFAIDSIVNQIDFSA